MMTTMMMMMMTMDSLSDLAMSGDFPMWRIRMEVGDDDDEFLPAERINPSSSCHDHHPFRWKFSHSLLGDAPIGWPSSFLCRTYSRTICEVFA